MAVSTSANAKKLPASPKADAKLATAIEAIADKAATDTTAIAKVKAEASPEPATITPRRRATDGVISEPGGPKNKYGIGEGAAWSLPKDGFTLAMAKLIAIKPGISLDEVSCVIHGQDSDGKPTRRGTTSVYQTWDLPRKGLGLKREKGGLHLLVPNGHTVKEVASAPSAKLDGLIEARGRDDLAELVARNTPGTLVTA